MIDYQDSIKLGLDFGVLTEEEADEMRFDPSRADAHPY